MTRLCRWTALASYFGLLLLLTVWLSWLAPTPHLPVLLPLIVLVGPLLFALRGLLSGSPYTHLWTALLALFYFVLGVNDLAGDTAPRVLAWLELMLSLALFASTLGYARRQGR